MTAAPGAAPTPEETPAAPAEETRVRVVLRGFPLALWRRSDEHHADLMREFALVTLDQADPAHDHDDVPVRLLALVQELQSRYADTTAAPERHRDAALAAGRDSVDLVYDVPAAAGAAAAGLLALLEEADEYCRRGAHLLTLASDPDVVAFRRWYLGQFVAQTAGAAPEPWRGPA